MVKSRKTNVAGKRLRRWFSKAVKQPMARRLQLIEHLESRQLMAIVPWTDGKFYPPIGKHTALLPDDLSLAEYIRRSDLTNSGSNNPPGGEGGPPVSLTEVEPNNFIGNATPVPLGTVPGKNVRVSIGGALPRSIVGQPDDIDHYVADLRGGDIVDLRITGNSVLYSLSVIDAVTNREIIGNSLPVGGGYPTASPLSIDGDASLAVVIPRDGRYFFRVGYDTDPTAPLANPGGNYTLVASAYRPVLEQEPIGTKQTIFLDFDGGIIDRNAFGVPGTARFSPFVDFLAGMGFQDSEESAVIDAIINVFNENMNDIGLKGTNGYFRNDGVAGNYDFVLLNSRDHADPFGMPNVSRIFIGGTQDELLVDTIGLAQSIDVGNFDTTEQAVVLMDILGGTAADPGLVAQVPIVGSRSRLDVAGNLIGNIAAHEAGHFFGLWHTLNSNTANQLIDTGGNILAYAGAGTDGILGTADDEDIDFGTDVYDPLASAISFGRQDSVNTMAYGLATGTLGGTVEGFVFNDKNRSGRLDSGETGILNAVVYADLNRNGALDQTEPRGNTAADGKYIFSVPAGTFPIRVNLGGNFVGTTRDSHIVTVNNNQAVKNVVFGGYVPNNTVTGFKWNDLNGDGVRDANEPTLSGIWIYLDLDGDKRLDIGEPADKTLADGSYRLTPPSAGTYTIREVLDPGYVMTYPAAGEHVVSYNGTTPLIGYDFGNQVALDWGDAPLPYPTQGNNNGAVHGFVAGLSLGSRIDTEAQGRILPNAVGDDNIGPVGADNKVIDDEDGIVFSRPIVAGDAQNQVTVTVTNSTGVASYLNGWMDFNADGDWNDAGEQIIKNLAVSTGTRVVKFSAPAGATIGDSFARFRLSQELNTPVGGRARAGEVEDYKMAVVDKLQLARDDQAKVSRNSINNQIDVLANDFKLPGESLRVVSVSQGSNGGRVSIQTGGGRVLYSPVNGFVGKDIFTYTMQNAEGVRSTATVTVDVALVFDKPVAVDDSFDVVVNSVGIPLNVLANDIEGKPGPLEITSVSTPDQGGSVVIGAGNQSLRYTPARDFGGTETFTYSAVDSAGNLTSARVTIHVIPGDRTDDVVEFSFKFVDSTGKVMTNPRVRQGESFGVQVYVDDLRGSSTVLPGVYAAFLDVLYDAYLVSPANAPVGQSSSLKFAVEFANQYTAFQQGTAEIPGLLDDFGAIYSNTNIPDRPDPTLFATLTFNAVAPGVATFVGDPADSPPFTDVLLSNSPNTPVATRQIRFGRASIQVVGDGVEFPQAVDDSVLPQVNVNSSNNRIYVLANDTPGSTNSIRLSEVTTPTNGGTAVINTNGTATPADDFISYTPKDDFRGKDQFTYTIRDSRGFASTATVTVAVGNQTGDVTLQLIVTNTSGTPIEQVEVGKPFQLRGYVQDTRSAAVAKGVFAAFQDILYDSEFVTVNTSTTNPLGFQTTFGANYDKLVSGDIVTKSIINEIGSVQDIEDVPLDQQGPLGGGRFLQFTITMTAKKATLTDTKFIGDPADIKPFHDTLLFEPPTAVPFSKIVYTFDTLKIVAPSGGSSEGFHNFANPYDVNNDGNISPIDVLGIINQLNKNGVSNLGGGGGGGEGESSKKFFVDVNNDGKLSPVDALSVINRLNQLQNGGGGGGEGEGEGEASNNTILACAALSHLRTSPGLVSQVIADTNSIAVPVQKHVMVFGPAVPNSPAPVSNLSGDLSDSDSDVDDIIASLASDVLDEWTNDLN